MQFINTIWDSCGHFYSNGGHLKHSSVHFKIKGSLEIKNWLTPRQPLLLPYEKKSKHKLNCKTNLFFKYFFFHY